MEVPLSARTPSPLIRANNPVTSRPTAGSSLVGLVPARRRDAPDLVIFGGGYTLYALNAATGALYWRHDYTGRPGQPPDPDQDGTRIFSSPVVVGDKVLFGIDVDGQGDYRATWWPPTWRPASRCGSSRPTSTAPGES